MTEIREITEKLKASPMFNLSLSSKELFHSNFLSWLGECNETKALFEYVIQELSEQKDFTLEGKKIGRENHNFDLSIESTLNDKEIVNFVIENKVKSFPKLKQLKEYENKVKQIQKEIPCTYILLSLFTTKKDIGVWKQKSYKDLAKALSKKTDALVTHLYYKEIIKDYTAFIENLDEISRLTAIEKEESYAYPQSIIYKELKEIRFEDFFLKAKYAQMAEIVYEELSVIFGEKNVKQDVGIKEIMNKTEKKETLYINHGFTRADGIIEIKIRAKDFVYLIQIQGDAYRRGFESYQRKMPPNKIFDEEQNWVNFQDISNEFENIEVYPVNGEKEYNQYGDAFKYKSIKISATKWNTTQVIARIVEDACTCVNFVKQR